MLKYYMRELKKSDVCRTCKVKNEYINKAVRLKSKLVQWTNTDQVLNLFIGNQKQYSFLSLMWSIFIFLLAK